PCGPGPHRGRLHRLPRARARSDRHRPPEGRRLRVLLGPLPSLPLRRLGRPRLRPPPLRDRRRQPLGRQRTVSPLPPPIAPPPPPKRPPSALGRPTSRAPPAGHATTASGSIERTKADPDTSASPPPASRAGVTPRGESEPMLPAGLLMIAIAAEPARATIGYA